jgi:3-deoxy-D-manno-octulosonate 8-phosphate phosphatase (KDO 8-P phosphatase)
MDKFNEELVKRAGKIKLLLCDVDGVLTDGCVYYSSRGEEMKRFSLRDGMGVERLREVVKVETGIITRENSEIVKKRVEKLGIKDYYPGSTDKLLTMKEISHIKNISADQVAYIGDDINDLEIMQHSGLSACPSDAFKIIRDLSHIVLDNEGGRGAFREFAEIIIFLKQKTLLNYRDFNFF